MLIETVRSLLALHPAGLSNEQLLWRLRNVGLRFSVDEVLQSLGDLVENGEVAVAELGRWRIVASRKLKDTAAVRLRSTHVCIEGNSTGPALTAVTAKIVKLPQHAITALGDAEGGKSADADWRALLRYYAATQRQDPRGRVDERADQHSVSWQLFSADGNWWGQGELHCLLDALPATFREALMRRPETVCSIGYPVGQFAQSGVPCFAPGLLLPAIYRLTASHLIVEITEAEAVINPVWLDLVIGRSRWQKEALVDALVPPNDAGDLADITNRLRSALATIGGHLLRPAQLSAEMHINAEGLRNAAGFFLPSDDRFTQGVERDLEVMQTWPEGMFRQTALGPLFTSRRDELQVTRVPATAISMTDRQYAVAASCLREPLTVIQGPPGTGKSEVILGLLTSIVLSGGSVLLASKNHQALDEVERRLAPLVEGAQVLTRGRDRDGERDTNFLSQMRALADGEILNDRATASNDAHAVLTRANDFLTLNSNAAHRTALHVELSEAIEQLSRWDDVLPGSPPSRNTWWTSVRIRFVRLLARHREQHPGGETPAQLGKLVERLRRELLSLPTQLEAEAWDILAEALALDVRAALQSSALRLTTPSRTEAAALVKRLKELDFNSQTRKPILEAEDARQVLRHRPAWAISTLSVASRIPLIPGLFDFVIFDEASQCDIASALPLLGRARSAVVVGDPMQLGFIPQLSLRQEHALMDAASIGRSGRHLVAQSKNSLFDFVRQRETAKWHFLSDQFRSTPEIVDYLNDEFYEGRLLSSQDPGRVRLPNGFASGISWNDVPGHTSREDGGSVNHAEADAIVATLIKIIRSQDFQGSVGVLSPFNSQVALLIRRIRAAITEAEQARVDLRVSTIDKFQGGEADVILLSLVVAEGVHSSTLNFYKRERRRVNVGISRARALCLVFGDKSFVRRSGVGLLVRLADRTGQPPKPRQTFDSEWERKLFEAMRRRGLDPIPQYPVAGRYLDFALNPEGKRLDVEVDGRRWHTNPDGNRKLADRLRDRALIALGWKVRRFWVHELANDMEKCLDVIERDLGHTSNESREPVV